MIDVHIANQCLPWLLVHHGQKETAIEILAKYHANGDLEDELVKHEYSEICLAIQLEAENPKVSFLNFTKTPDNRRRLLVLLTMSTGTVGYILGPDIEDKVKIENARIRSVTASSPIISHQY